MGFLSQESRGCVESLGLLHFHRGLDCLAQLPCDWVRDRLHETESRHLQQLEGDCGWTRDCHSCPKLPDKHAWLCKGLTDAGMIGDNAFYMSTGGWKYDNPY